ECPYRCPSGTGGWRRSLRHPFLMAVRGAPAGWGSGVWDATHPRHPSRQGKREGLGDYIMPSADLAGGSTSAEISTAGLLVLFFHQWARLPDSAVTSPSG